MLAANRTRKAIPSLGWEQVEELISPNFNSALAPILDRRPCLVLLGYRLFGSENRNGSFRQVRRLCVSVVAASYPHGHSR